MAATQKKKRVVSGMRPTGRLHIGHYFGALQNWVKLQNDPAYECFYFIADWHALTSDYADTSAVAQNTLDIAIDYLAAGLDRGMWVEFEGEDGQLAFAKLAWVSPLRGTYLFTNRQGQKAVSLTADELAERFRTDRARLVEAEPLIDRAFTSMVQTLEQKFGEVAAAPA